MKHVRELEPDIIKKGMPMITLAVMGCAVNGPGEASGADIGVACGNRKGLLFRKGETIGTVPEEEIESALMKELAGLMEEVSGTRVN